MTEKRDFNPTITAFFDEPVFGVDATENTSDKYVVKGETKSGKKYIKELGSAFKSPRINQDGLNIIQTVKLGDTLLLRQSRNLNKSGGRTFYLEILRDSPNWKQQTETEESI